MTAWIAVASAEHVARGQSEGFMQVCHGKKGPLTRIRPNDTVIYYSPSQVMGISDRLQSFTAAGTVINRDPYLFDMGGGFIPTRRGVDWHETQPTPIAPLFDRLELTRGIRNWGYIFRFGVVKITEADCAVILAAMGVTAPPRTMALTHEIQQDLFSDRSALSMM